MPQVRNWWTTCSPARPDLGPLEVCRSKVRHYLSCYLDLSRACYLDCAMEAEPESAGRHCRFRADPRWTDLVAIKADLDREICRLPRRLALVVVMYYVCGYTQREIGRRLGVSGARVHQLIAAAVGRISRNLAKRPFTM